MRWESNPRGAGVEQKNAASEKKRGPPKRIMKCPSQKNQRGKGLERLLIWVKKARNVKDKGCEIRKRGRGKITSDKTEIYRTTTSQTRILEKRKTSEKWKMVNGSPSVRRLFLNLWLKGGVMSEKNQKKGG